MIPPFAPTEYRDKYGNPLTLMEWAKLFEDTNYRIIKNTDLGTHRVSTIWLGHPLCIISNSFYFETMVFTNDESNQWESMDMDRYNTLDEAVAGHEMMVEECTKKLKDKNENI